MGDAGRDERTGWLQMAGGCPLTPGTRQPNQLATNHPAASNTKLVRRASGPARGHHGRISGAIERRGVVPPEGTGH